MLVLLVFGLVVGTPGTVQGLSSVSQRVFYLASSGQGGSLSSISPPAGLPFGKNFSGFPISFGLGAPLLDQMSISGPLAFSLWVGWTGNSSGAPSIVGSFDYKYPSGQWSNFSAAPAQRLTFGLQNASFTYNIIGTPLITGTSVAVSVNVTSIPNKASITLYWGSINRPSFVALPFTGYITIPLPDPVSITDLQSHTNNFALNPGPGNNILQFRVHVRSALGFSDIGRVNMTIVDPYSHALRDRSNVSMQPLEQNPTGSPYTYLGSWTYPSNATVGTYQVSIDVVDVQGLVAFGLRGSASFGIVPPGYVPFPYNLIPYFAGGSGGLAAVAGVAYYRKRRRKSYLAPFEHFNTLTAGELDGGTVSIEGNTGSGKTILSEQLMFEDLKSGRPCIFVSTSDFPSNVRSGMKQMGLDVTGYEQSGLLTFVDAYSAEAGQGSTEKFSVPSIGDLTTLGMKISSSLPTQKSKGASLYFDSLVPLASKTKPESIVSFVQSVGAKMKGIGGKAVFTLGPSVDPMVQKQLEDMSDCVVQMEAFEERGVRRRRLKIAKLRARRHQEGWNVFVIEDGKGIIFYSKKPKA
jgi:KaiC/GvpD/RAD55 family RecA-like ATPase